MKTKYTKRNKRSISVSVSDSDKFRRASTSKLVKLVFNNREILVENIDRRLSDDESELFELPLDIPTPRMLYDVKFIDLIFRPIGEATFVQRMEILSGKHLIEKSKHNDR